MILSTSAVAVCCCRDFAQLVEQPCILDGDDGLSGKVLHQRDLLVGEGADLLAVNDDGADQLILLEHRDSNVRPRTRELGGRRLGRRRQVDAVNHLLGA